MKKLFLLITILLLATYALFAIDTLKVELDLGANPIFLCGITNEPTTVTSGSFSYDDAVELSRTAIDELVISSADVNNKDETAEGSFYIWWYIYSPKAYTISTYFNDFIGESGNRIPFTIETEGIANPISSQANATNANKSTLKTLDASDMLNKGHQIVTVPSFNLTGLPIDVYSTNIVIEISANE